MLWILPTGDQPLLDMSFGKPLSHSQAQSSLKQVSVRLYSEPEWLIIWDHRRELCGKSEKKNKKRILWTGHKSEHTRQTPEYWKIDVLSKIYQTLASCVLNLLRGVNQLVQSPSIRTPFLDQLLIQILLSSLYILILDSFSRGPNIFVEL